MTTLTLGAVVGLLGLGALHGINPAMGWLFAVALGMQEGGTRAVWRALPPLAVGHALAIGVVVALAALLGAAIPPEALRWGVAGTLVGFGAYRMVRTGHPRYGGMRVGARELTVWSFLMASAHGAGLMVLPFLLGGGGMVAGDFPGLHAAHTGEGHAALVVDTAAPTGPLDAAEPFGATRPPMPEVLRALPYGTTGMVDTVVGAGGASMAEPMVAGVASSQLVGLLMTMVHTAGYLLVTGLVAVVVYRRVGLNVLRRAWINLDVIWAAALILTGLGAVLA